MMMMMMMMMTHARPPASSQRVERDAKRFERRASTRGEGLDGRARAIKDAGARDKGRIRIRIRITLNRI